MTEMWGLAGPLSGTDPMLTYNWNVLDDVNGTYPFCLAPNEALVLNYVIAGAAAHAATLSWQVAWTETEDF